MKVFKELNLSIRRGILDNTIDDFSEESINKRRKGNFLLRNLFKVAIISKRPKLLNKPVLNEGENYIFASSHSYEDDVITNICMTKANMYILMGGTDQILFNPLVPVTVLNGVIRIDILDKKSRNEVPKIVENVLDYTNILMYPEGSYCDSENRLHEGLFDSMYRLSSKKHVKVIPICNVFDMDKKRTFIMYGDPIEGYNMSKDEFMNLYSESISTMTYHIIETCIAPLTKKKMYSKYGSDYQSGATLDYFKKRFDCYAKDDTERGWIENFYHKRDLDQYEPDEFVKDRVSMYENINPYSPLGVESEYYKLHDFEGFVRERNGYKMKSPLKEPLFVLTRKLKKLFSTKEEIVDYLLSSLLVLDNGSFLELREYVLNEVSSLSIDDTVKYVLDEIICMSYTKQEALSEIDKSLTLKFTKYQKPVL